MLDPTVVSEENCRPDADPPADRNPGESHKTEPEFFGLVAQSAADNSVLVAIRGTDTFLRVADRRGIHPRAVSGSARRHGLVEDGFASVYATLPVSKPVPTSICRW